MEINELQQLWKQQQKQLNAQKKINKHLIENMMKSKTMWLAPKPQVFIVLFVICGLYALAAMFFAQLYWTWMIVLMAIYGIYQTLWQIDYKKRINNMEGGLVGMERNLIEYRKRYDRSKREMWFVVIPYLVWFGWYLYQTLDLQLAVGIFVITIALMIVAYRLRNQKTYGALHELEQYLNELQEFEEEM